MGRATVARANVSVGNAGPETLRGRYAADCLPLGGGANFPHRLTRPPKGRRMHRSEAIREGRAAVLGLLWLGVLAACAGRQPATEARHTAFRVRADRDAPLNADQGWADGANADVTVYADRPFRVRFEVEGVAVAEPLAFRLQARRNGGAWENVSAADFPYPDEIASPRVSVVDTKGYPAGAATHDVLRGSTLPFRPGTGVALDSLTRPWRGDGAHGEWEWPVVIRRFADGAVTGEPGDVFQLRLADAAGRPLRGGPLPSLTLAVPPRLLGGTYVETPGRLGPWQSPHGDLYFVMEPAETYNVLMVVRSTDGGESWREVDGAHRPATDDLEGFATAYHGGVVHMLHQTTRQVHYHAFRTAGDPGVADGWLVRDEPVAEPGEPPTQVASLVAREDGSLVGVYGDSRGLRYRIRAPRGGWGPERTVEAAGLVLSGPQLASAGEGAVQLAYTAGDGTQRSVWTRTIGPDGALGPAWLVDTGAGAREEDSGAVLPLVYLPETGETVILYRLADGALWERRIGRTGPPTPPVRVTDRRVAQSPVDSDQAGGDAIGRGGAVHVLFIDEETRDLFHVRRDAAGAWEPALPVVAGIDAQWVRGNLLRRPDGAEVYGFVYDAGSDGGSGMNRYGEVPLDPR